MKKQRIEDIALNELREDINEDKEELKKILQSMNITDQQLDLIKRFLTLEQWKQNFYLMVREMGGCRAFGRKYKVSHATVANYLKEIKKEFL